MQDLLQSSSSLFLELETVHKPPQVGDEALLLVRTDDEEEERAGGREGLQKVVEMVEEGGGGWSDGDAPLGEGEAWIG